MGVGNYTEGQKKEAVKALALNGMNYYLTSNQLNISISSLKRWRDEYPDMVKSGDAAFTAKILREGDEAQESFIQKVMAGKDLAINRILTLIPNEKNISTLLAVVESLNAIAEGSKDGGRDTTSIFLQVNNQINQLNQVSDE